MLVEDLEKESESLRALQPQDRGDVYKNCRIRPPWDREVPECFGHREKADSSRRSYVAFVLGGWEVT